MYNTLIPTTIYFHREPPTCTDGRNGSYMGFGPRRDRVKVKSPPVGKKSPSASRSPAAKKIKKGIIYVNKDLKPSDIFHTIPSMTHNSVVYWEFKAG